MENPSVELSRDINATTIPYGGDIILHQGDNVRVVQQLGGSITVSTQYGYLVRVDGDDADALGITLEPIVVDSDPSKPFDMQRVMDGLSTIYDPEIPVSIVELGLVYRCEEIIKEDGTRRIEIDMTMTAPGCGMGDVLRNDALSVVSAVPGVNEVEVNVVWDPPWNLSMMSDAAKLQLGML